MSQTQILLEKITREGLNEEALDSAFSILKLALEKRGMEVTTPGQAINDTKKLLASDLDPVERATIMASILSLACHHEFERTSRAREYQDFEAGKNQIIFAHPVTGQDIGPFDKKTLDLIIRTRAMMLFPEQKNRSLREKLIRAAGRNLNLARDEKTSGLVFKRYLRMMIVGVVFKIQCEHWAVGQRKRSLNVIMAANEKGFFTEWEKASIHIGTARKYMKDFATVRHLLAADLALTWIDKQENPEFHQAGTFDVAFISFLVSPARFFLAAEQYRQWALDAGFIKRKKDLWMPEGWRSLVQDAQSLELGQFNPDYPEEIRKFDDFENEYKTEKEWMNC